MNTLEEMINELGQEKANKILMEFMLLTASKAMKCDQLAEALEDDNCTIEQLREILYG